MVPSVRVVRRRAAVFSYFLALVGHAILGSRQAAHGAVVHQYSFNHGAYDSVGGAHGTLYGDEGQFINGNLDLTGNHVEGVHMGSDLTNGGSYVDLPNNMLLALNGQFTIETWFTVPEDGTYAFMYSFGISGSFVEGEAAGGDGEYIGVIAPHSSVTSRGVPNSDIDGGPIEIQLGLGEDLPRDVMQHYVVTFDVNDHSVPIEGAEGEGVPSGGTIKLYWNGVFIDSQYIVPYLDLTDFQDVNSWLGRAPWNDPLFDGVFHEFTIHNTVLTEAQALAEFNAGIVPPETPGVVGDVNGDGLVTIADWNVIKSNMFTGQGSAAAGDISYDGWVDQADFRIWKTAYLAGGGSLAAIPEPSSALLATGIAAGLLWWRRAKRASVAAMTATSLLVAGQGMEQASADTNWVGPSGGDYANPANWLSTDGFPGVPDVTYDNWATITAGTVNVSTDLAPIVGPEIRIEGSAPVVFNIVPGGQLTLDGNFSFYANNNAASALNMTGGSLTAHSLWMFATKPTLSLSGNASITAVWQDGGGIYLPPLTRIEGPNVHVEAINQYGYVGFQTNGTYTAVITGPNHSRVQSSRDIGIYGDLVLEFSGYTPTLGETWDLAYAANEIGGEKQGKFKNVDASSAGTLPAGVGFYQSIVPGPGGTGEILRLALIRQLSLTVNRATGEVRINNPGAGATDFNGYSLRSTAEAISVPSWNSLDDQNIGTFAEVVVGPGGGEEAEQTPTSSFIQEAATSSYNVGATSYLSLGNVFNPQPASIGDDIESISFSYTTASGLVVDAAVSYEGRGRNNLVVAVDPATGNAYVDNESDFTVSLDGYSIKSAGGALKPTGWSSLEDQGTSGWDEANATANRLSEFNINSSLTLAPGQTFSLGSIMNTGGSVPQDLVFEFLLSDRSKLITGVVDYVAAVGGLPGDFDSNGTVNNADLTLWKAGFGTTYDGGDFLAWQRNFGASASTAAAAAVPEPTSMWLAVMLGLCLPAIARRRA